MGRFDVSTVGRLPLGDRVVTLHGPLDKDWGHEVFIGTTINDRGVNGKRRKFKLVEAPVPGSCKGCDFLFNGVCWKSHKATCSAYSRVDRTWVIFKIVDGTTK